MSIFIFEKFYIVNVNLTVTSNQKTIFCKLITEYKVLFCHELVKQHFQKLKLSDTYQLKFYKRKYYVYEIFILILALDHISHSKFGIKS